MLRLNNIDKVHQNGSQITHVLRRFGLEVGQGEFVTLVGPAGSGKSALISIVAMLDPDWSGEYFFMDQHVHRLKPKERVELSRRNIGLVSQGNDLLDELTSAENLDVSIEHLNMKRSARVALVARTLERFGIPSTRDLHPRQLSGGEQQLLRIARATIAGPRLILADEPTSHLHPIRGKEIMAMFREMADSGTTILQVTHSEADAAYGDRVIELLDGQVQKESIVAERIGREKAIVANTSLTS